MHTLVVLVVAVVVSSCVSFAAAKLAEPEPVRAGGDPSAKLLKEIRNELDEANVSLLDIAYSTSRTCQAVRPSVTHSCERAR